LREEHTPQLASARILEDGIGLLKISNFEEGTAAAVEARIKMLESSGIKGLLVDLRGSATGRVEEAVKVADFFLGKGKKIGVLKDRQAKATDFVSLNDPLIANIPMVVLVSGGTSGPAELVAAALQDEHGARIVGERTNGRGSEQQLYTLADGSALLISTGLYYRPNGKPLQDQNLRNSGIAPDVRSPDEDFVTNYYFENVSEESDKSFDEDFYRKLNGAVDAEQLRSALKEIRERVLKQAA
jgi:carboxyl-terminal processing protease